MPASTCPDELRLEDYFYGDLAPLEVLLVRLHTARCPECRARLDELRKFNDVFRLCPPEEPPQGFEEDLLRMVRSWEFEPDPAPYRMEETSPEETVQVSRSYKVRWAVASLVLVLGSILQYKYGPAIQGLFGKGTSLLSSLQDLNTFWKYVVSGAWWDNLVALISAVRIDGLASLGILRSALPSQIVSVLVFGGITVVVFFVQRWSSKDGGEGVQ